MLLRRAGGGTGLKALLTVHGIHAPRTHDIEHLHSLLPAPAGLSVAGRDLAYLSTCGIDVWWEPDREQAERAVEIAARVRDEAAALREPARTARPAGEPKHCLL